jgi:hypothetical protein
MTVNAPSLMLIPVSAIIKPVPIVLISVAESKPHHLVGAGAITRCSSGSDGSCSKLHVYHRWIIKDVTISFLLLPFKFVTISIIRKSNGEIDMILRLSFICFQKVGLLYSRKGAGAASKNFPGAGAAYK